MRNILKYNIDLNKLVNDVRTIQQHDDLEFQITIRNNDHYYDLTNVECDFWFEDGEGNVILNYCTIYKERNHIKVIMQDNECTRHHGLSKFQLELKGLEGKRYSYPFSININKSLTVGLDEEKPVTPNIKNIFDYVRDLNIKRIEDQWVYPINKEMWQFNIKERLYEYTVSHDLNSTNIIYNAISVESGELLNLGGKVIDEGNIKFKIDNPEDINIVMIARYMTTLKKKGTFDNEVVDARMGKATLKEKFTEIINRVELKDNDYGTF